MDGEEVTIAEGKEEQWEGDLDKGKELWIQGNKRDIRLG